jgi:selenide,water dikinase
MGGRPIMALAILGMPLGKIAPATVREILKGGAAICAEAGIPVAGGHSIDCPEPVYGLAVIGTAKPGEIRRNSGAKAGDALILTKALGVGIYSAAFKKDALSAEAYAEMLRSVTLLNKVGAELARDPDIHAVTDVTGFGILGHGLEMARGSGLTVTIDHAALPLFQEAASLARAGYVTGASTRNWDSYGEAVLLPEGIEPWQRQLLTDPQTSGGLLIACAPDRADELVGRIVEAGYPSARIVGRAEAGPPQVKVM